MKVEERGNRNIRRRERERIQGLGVMEKRGECRDGERGEPMEFGCLDSNLIRRE